MALLSSLLFNTIPDILMLPWWCTLKSIAGFHPVKERREDIERTRRDNTLCWFVEWNFSILDKFKFLDYWEKLLFGTYPTVLNIEVSSFQVVGFWGNILPYYTSCQCF